MATASYYFNFDSVSSSWQDGLLILMYHSIGTPPLRHDYRGLHVEPATLRSQLKELQTSGARFVSLTDSLQNSGGERQVAVTFDDGFRDALLLGLPVLRELKVPAINYIVADRIGEMNVWDRHLNVRPSPLMTHEEIVEWLQAGHEIGSHTLTHPHLPSISSTEARREIIDSKKKLEDLFGKPVLHFCYPYGEWTESIRDLVAEAGYQTACTTLGGYNHDTHSLALERFLAMHRRPYAVALGRSLLTFFKLR